MICQWHMGLLVMRECGAPASSGCAMCGRQLCIAHTMMGRNGPACPQCASTNEGYEKTEDTEMASSREEYYRPYGGAAGYGQAGYFSDSDSAAMNRPGLPPLKPKRDEYDAMET
ncbi:MAG: hypothetical protein ACKV2U_31420 [Bryobacteraceae bacterium]